MSTINDKKDTAVTWRTLLLAKFTFPDATILRVATLAVTYPSGGNAYSARIDEQEIERLAALSEQGIDRVPSATLRLADPDAYLWTTYERGHGFKGASLELRFVLYDTTTDTFTTDSLVPFIGLCDTPGIDEKYLTVTAANKLNLTKFMVPSVPIQQRCPWSNPITLAQRALAADSLSRYYPCGETRDLTTAPPCAYTRATCTQPTHFAGVTWSPEAGGSGKEYISGSKVAWRNVDTSAKYKEYWPLWLGGWCWVECRSLNVAGDGNYTRGEVAVGLGAVEIQRVILNGVELSLGTTGDYRWHVVNDGSRAGTPNADRPYNSLGDPYGGLTAIQVLAPRAVWSPDSEPSIRILGRRETLRVYRRVVSAAGSGGGIVVTLDGANEDCAGNPPFAVTIVGNTWATANGTHTLTNWAWGPPGTITLTTTGTGSGTGGYLYYEVSGAISGSAGGASSPWLLLELLRQARYDFSDFDPYTWADSAKLCNAILTYTSEPRFTSSVAVRQRRSVAELARGLRQSIGGLLVPGSDGLLRLQIEGPLAEQQPAAMDGSNYDTPISSKTRAGVVTNGYAAYRFDESNSWGLKRAQQSLADQPNRVSFSFSDPAHSHAVSTFALVDSDDLERADQEIPGGLQVEPEGIASYNHALRAAKLGLAKIHRGNPTGDTRGTDWWEWQTTFRGCKLAIGQIVAQNSTRYGLTNSLVRLTEIRPTKNFENVTLRGHAHNDDWYLDSVGDIVGPVYSAHKHDRLARPAFPWAPDLQVPITGDVIFGADRSFSVQPTYETQADGTALVRLLIGGKLPVNVLNALSTPGIALQATVATTGGTISGNITLYVVIAAKDADGKLSGLSPALCRADVPAGTNTNTVTVAVNDWDATTTGYSVFAGTNPNRMSWQQDGVGTPASVILTSLTTGRYGPPDVEFDRLLLRIKRVAHSGVFGAQITAAGANTFTITGAGWTINQWANYDCSILAKADGSAIPIADFTVSSNTADTLTVSPNPAGLGFVVGDVLVMRSRPTVGSDAGGDYLLDANWVNSFGVAGLTVDAEKSNILRIIAGPGAGQSYTIKSNTATKVYIEGDWYTTPTTASRYIIEESSWQVSKIDGPYENSDSAALTSLAIDADNWKDKTILVQAVALDGNGAMGFEPLAPVRDLWVFGDVAQSMSTLPPDTSLLAYWSMDEGSGAVIQDDSGHGNTGAITGATFADGMAGKCLSFDAVDDTVVATVTGIPLGAAVRTLSCWFKTSSLPPVGHNGFILAYGFYSAGEAVVLFENGTGNVGSSLWGGGDVLSALPKHDGLWHHLVYVYDGAFNHLYVDGVLEGSNATVPNTSAGVFRINGTELLECLIDEVRIYNVALTQQQVTALYSIPGGSPGVVVAPGIPTSPILTVWTGLTEYTEKFGVTTSWTAPSPIGSVTGYDREVRYYANANKTDPLTDWIPLGAVGLVLTAQSGPFPRPTVTEYICFRVRSINALNTASAWAETAATLPGVAPQAIPATPATNTSTIQEAAVGGIPSFRFHLVTTTGGGSTAGFVAQARYYSDSGATTPTSEWIPLGWIDPALLTLDTDYWPRPAVQDYAKVRIAAQNSGNAISAWLESSILTRTAAGSSFVPEAGVAPNQTPVIAGDNACRVVDRGIGTASVWKFAGAVTCATSGAGYSDLAYLEIVAKLTSGVTADRVLGYLDLPAPGGGNVDVLWYTDEWPRPLVDDTWTLEFRCYNLNWVMTAAPPTVAGLVVKALSTDTSLVIQPVTSFTVTDLGMTPDQKYREFSCQWTMPAIMTNAWGVKVRITGVTKFPSGQDVTELISFPTTYAGLPFGRVVGIAAADLPAIGDSPENWTFKAITVNATQDGDNTATAPSVVKSVATGGTVPDLLLPLLPTLVVLAETGSRYPGQYNETMTTMRATVTLPANHRATFMQCWLSTDNGSTWNQVYDKWDASTGIIQWPEYVPTATATSSWKVKVVTGNAHGVNAIANAVLSAAITVLGIGAPNVTGASSASVGTVTPSRDSDGHWWWALDYIKWTPAGDDPNYWLSGVTVQLVDASGNPAPGEPGTERFIGATTDAPGVEFYAYSPFNWPIPAADDTYRTFRFRIRVVNRLAARYIYTGCWPGAADYYDVTPSVQTGAIQIQRADPTVLGSALSIGLDVAGGTSKLRLANTNVSNVLWNADFQLAHPTIASWVDKWTAVNAATRQASGMESGQYLIRLGYHASGSSIYSGQIRVSPGQRYALSARLKADATPGGSIQMFFRYLQADQTYISDSAYNFGVTTTSWATYGYSGPTAGVPALGYWMEVYIGADPDNGKYYYIDRAELTLVTVQQDAIDATTSTAVTLGQHLNGASQFVGVGVRRSTGWATEQRDNYFELKCPSGRTLIGIYGADAAVDFGQINVQSDTAGTYPRLVFSASGPSITLELDGTHYIGLSFVGEEARLYMNGVLKLSEA